MSTSIGRLPAAQNRIINDNHSDVVKALLSNQDKMIDLIEVLCQKLDADAGVTDTNYTALVANQITKVDLSQ